MLNYYYILLIFILITLFLPLGFLVKGLNYFRFDFFLQMVIVIFILFIFNLNNTFVFNICCWFFIIYLSLNIKVVNSTWEWFFLILFVYASLFIILIGFMSNFLSLFILLESQVIVLLLLTQIENNSLVNVEAIARWILLNLISSLFLIMSFGLIYQFYGVINLIDILLLDVNTLLIDKLPFVFFYISFLFKIGLPPFHFWLPDIYEVSNLQLITLLIAPMKLLYLIILENIVLISYNFNDFFVIIGFLSMFIGLLFALNQTIIKKFLGWTGIFYFGAFVLLMPNLTIENAFYLQMYILIYLFSSFVFVIFVQINIQRLVDFMYVFTDNFLIGLFFLGLLIIMMGLPIMAGFFTKLIFFYNLITNDFLIIFVIFLLTLTSFAGFYYLNTYILSLSFKYLVENINLIDKVQFKLNLFIYFVFILFLLLIFYPYQLSTLFLYF